MTPVLTRPLLHFLPPLLLWLASLIYVGMALGYNEDARLIPLLVGGVLVLLLPIDLLSMTDTPIGARLRASVNPAAELTEPEEDEKATMGKQARALACMLIFAASLPIIGIPLAIPLYVAASMRLLGGRPWLQAIITGAVVGLSSYLLFTSLLDVQLYPGLLFGAL